jgi:hypothetical protein
MADPKKHHFSPVFYLTGWRDSHGTVIEYSRPYSRVVARNVPPTATGYKLFLYTLEGQPEDKKQYIEKNYMGPIVDDRAAYALRILIAGDKGALTGEMRSHWTRFLLASLLRRPLAVEQVVNTFRDLLSQNLEADAASYGAMKNEDDPPTAYEWLEKNFPHLIADRGKQAVIAGIENQGIGDIIINMQWSTLDMSMSRHELLTGDMPHLRYYGLKDKRCTILFPLNPTKLFIATHDRKAEAAILSRSPTEVVQSVNDELTRLAERYVYGRTKSHLRFVEDRLRLSSAPTLPVGQGTPPDFRSLR